jgi:hypothetical protein
MMKFPLILILLVLQSWPMESGTGTVSQKSNAGKNPAASSRNSEERGKPGDEATAKPRGKTNPKDKEDCGCETTLFGEPVPQPGKTVAQKKGGKGPSKQTSKSSGKNENGAKPAAKSEQKEETSYKTTR